MDELLRQTIKLAHVVRDSQEASSWRQAWRSLLDNKPQDPQAMATHSQIPIADLVYYARASDQAECRPMIFPLLLAIPPFALSPDQVKKELGRRPPIWAAYRRLTDCLRFIGLIVTFIRHLGSGYPHESLAYTLPDAPWSRLSSDMELPWDFGAGLLQTNSTDAMYIGLNRFIPSVSKQAAECLNAIVVALKTDISWTALRTSYETVAPRKNIMEELQRARTQVQKQVEALRHANMPPYMWRMRIEEIAQKAYAKRGPRIMAYSEAFWKYEHTVERIYWSVSQIVMYERISYLSSADATQLQQVNFSVGEDGIMTALAPTWAETLNIGQLVHITFPEAGGAFDGLYRVEDLHKIYSVTTGARLLFRAKWLWGCQISDLIDAARGLTKPIFLPSERHGGITDTRIELMRDDGTAMSLNVADSIPRYEYSKTIYLP